MGSHGLPPKVSASLISAATGQGSLDRYKVLLTNYRPDEDKSDSSSDSVTILRESQTDSSFTSNRILQPTSPGKKKLQRNKSHSMPLSSTGGKKSPEKMNTRKLSPPIFRPPAPKVIPFTRENDRVDEAKTVEHACCSTRSYLQRPPSAPVREIPKSTVRSFDRPHFLQRYGHLLHKNKKWREELHQLKFREEEKPIKPLDAWLKDSMPRTSVGYTQDEWRPHMSCKFCQSNVRKELMRCLKTHTCLSHYLLPSVAVDVLITGTQRPQPERKVECPTCRLMPALSVTSDIVCNEDGNVERGIQTSKFLLGRWGYQEIDPENFICPIKGSEHRHSLVLGLPTKTSGAAVLHSFHPSEKGKLLRLLAQLSKVDERETGSEAKEKHEGKPHRVHMLDTSASDLKKREECTKKLEKLIALLIHFPATVQHVKARSHAYKIRQADHVCRPSCFEARTHSKRFIDHATLLRELVTLIKSLRDQPDLMEKLLDSYDKLVGLE